jgi:hypothetical protein
MIIPQTPSDERIKRDKTVIDITSIFNHYKELSQNKGKILPKRKLPNYYQTKAVIEKHIKEFGWEIKTILELIDIGFESGKLVGGNYYEITKIFKHGF